jgi:3-oxoacyl-[acyl-carrier protein] reductase
MKRSRPVVVISGISSGIGLATARRFRSDGWQIIGVDIDASSNTLADEMIVADLATPAGINFAEEQLSGQRAGAFVHSAGVMRDDTDLETIADAGATLWTLHVGAAARLAQTLLPNMPDQRGRLVFLSSRAARGRAGRGLYAASKAALDGLIRSLAIEQAPRGITVNAVAPAATQTPQLTDSARKDAAVQPLPIGRVIQPDEVAATIAFLASQDAGAITGQTIYQCGGASIAGAKR